MSNFRPTGRQTSLLMLPMVEVWLPSSYMAHFVVNTLFLAVVKLARKTGVRKTGTVELDGTTIHATASPGRALSYEPAGNIEKQSRLDIADSNTIEVAISWPETCVTGCRGQTA